MTAFSKLAQWYLIFLSRYPSESGVVVKFTWSSFERVSDERNVTTSIGRDRTFKVPGAQFRPIPAICGRCCWRSAEFRVRSNEIYKSPRKLRACDWSLLFVVTRYSAMPATARERDASGAACAAGRRSRRCTRESEEPRNRVHLSDIRSILQT